MPVKEYGYNKNGALIQDFNRGISGIKYNLLNLPQHNIQFSYGHSTDYTYNASGVKQKVVHTTVTNNLNVPMGSTMANNQSSYVLNILTTDYCGHIVYENGQLRYVLNDEGFTTLASSGNPNKYAYNYYIKDHLGNNRSVIQWTGRSFIPSNTWTAQENNYYPFGMPYSNTYSSNSEQPSFQPYKYGGKEYDMMHGLNWYDFEARMRDGILPVFTNPDPLAEKYYNISPYAYCANNPVNRIDPDGRDSYYTNDGQFIYTDNKETDEIRIVNNYMEQLINMAKSSSSGKINVQEAIQDGKIESIGIDNADVSAEAYSNIFTDVLSKMDDVNIKELFKGRVSTAIFDGNSYQPTLTSNYNTNIETYDETASHQGIKGKSLVTANIVIGGKKDNRYLYSTASNVQNMLGAHEFLGHGMNNWGAGSKTHYRVYEFQMAHPTWQNTTPQYKTFMNMLYQRYLNPKR